MLRWPLENIVPFQMNTDQNTLRRLPHTHTRLTLIIRPYKIKISKYRPPHRPPIHKKTPKFDVKFEILVIITSGFYQYKLQSSSY